MGNLECKAIVKRPPRGADDDKIQSMNDVTDKIAKLLRLAGQQDNDNEAATAFAHAQKLATLHGLDLDDIDTSTDEEPPPPREVGTILKRSIETWHKATGWQIIIARAVTRANACRYYYRSGRDGGIVAYGQEQDVETVATMYRAIVHQCRARAKAAVRAYSAAPEYDPLSDVSPRTYGRDFRIGFADKVAARLRPAREVVREQRVLISERVTQSEITPGASCRALARIDAAAGYLKRVDTALNDAAKSYRLRAGSGFTGAAGSSGYWSGRRAGAGASLGRGKGIAS